MSVERTLRALSAAALISFGAACSDNGGAENGNNEEVPSFPSYCHITEWECEEFVDGPDLPSNRHGHAAVVLDHERVLLAGGFERLESGTSTRIDTCEIVNPLTEEVRDVACFNRPRRDATLVKMADGSVLALGGTSPDNQRLTSVERFDPDEETWENRAPMTIPYRAHTFEPMLMEDGRLFLLRINEVFGAHNPAHLAAEIYDPELDSWSEVTGLPDMEVDTMGAAMLPGDKVLVVIAEPDNITRNPPPPEDPNEDPRPGGHVLRMGIFDIATGEFEERPRFSGIRGVGLRPQVTRLPGRGFYMIVIPGDVEEPAYGYLFDGESYFREQFFERDPAPGWISTVLTGDRVLFQSNEFSQYFDLDSGVWWQFDAFSPGLYFSSIVRLEDCRLFGSGERAFQVSEEEAEAGVQPAPLRGVDTGFCTPLGEPVDNRDL